MTKTDNQKEDRICQGDLFKDVEYIEYAVEKSGKFEISKIVFPYVIVLTQDCDLQQDFNSRQNNKDSHDKHLISTLVAPLYNIEHLYEGEHLSEVGLTMQKIPRNKTQGTYLKQNQLPRYHYLDFSDEIPVPNAVIDFKHYFSTNIEYLLRIKNENFICKVSSLYRENISQRFASFLSRIGLPNKDGVGYGIYDQPPL